MTTMPTAAVHALYHVVPLHYTPYLLASGTLFSQAQLKENCPAILPRPTVARRDRKLRLDQFVHLSPIPITPLLRDKFQRGYPHVLIAFSSAVLELPTTALIRYNPKSWRHREDFLPVIDDTEKAMIWDEWRNGKYPSLEVVVKDSLPLHPFALFLAFSDSWQTNYITGFCHDLRITLSLPIAFWESHWPICAEFDRLPYEIYAAQCRDVGVLLPPPSLPFD